MFPDALSISREHLCVCVQMYAEREGLLKDVKYSESPTHFFLILWCLKAGRYFCSGFILMSADQFHVFSLGKSKRKHKQLNVYLWREGLRRHTSFFFRWTPQTFCFLCSFSCSCYSALSFLLDV